MKRVLIVDDEYLVRLGLKTTIDWEAHGYRIVGEASNGREAMELFDEASPDILLTDIKMTVMDGLELLSELRDRGWKVQVVILSNYDDFSYARRAMELGATRYLLKSEISETVLIDLLQSLRLEAQEESAPVDDPATGRRKYLQEQMFGIPADADIPADSIEPPPSRMFPDSPYLAVRCGCLLQAQDEQSAEMPLKTLRSIVSSSMEFAEAAGCSTVFRGNFYLTMLCSVKMLEPDYTRRFMEHCRPMIRHIKNYLGLDFRIGVSSIGSSEAFPRMLSEAEQARKEGFFTQDSITAFQEAPVPEDLSAVRVSHSRVKTLVQGRSQDRLDAYIGEIFEKLAEYRSYSALRNAFFDLLSVAKSICDELSLDLSTGLNRVKFDYDNLSRISSLEHALRYVLEIYDTIFQAMRGNNSDYSHTIRRCMEYIENNYRNNISLEDVARAVEISSSYLSMTFKQETGINFVTYLNEYRIEKARELLSGTGLKIYEVADQVGFSSPYYFSRVFKEITGHSCKEYRDRFFGKKNV